VLTDALSPVSVDPKVVVSDAKRLRQRVARVLLNLA
jgi:hypothetical protein